VEPLKRKVATCVVNGRDSPRFLFFLSMVMGDVVMEPLKAPFPWFGGKRLVAPIVWKRFGSVVNYVEPFFGSGACLLGRPVPFDGPETINDLDGYVANFWRAVQADPEAVARWSDNPVNENDLHARHSWLVARKAEFADQLNGCPDFFDAKVAGWWCWGLCCWIGSGWCSGQGPWQSVEMEDGTRQLVHLGDAGQGVNRQLVHLNAGRGVNRQRVHLGDAGRGDPQACDGILDWMLALADRIKRVRVCSGDWSRVCGPTPTTKQGLTGVFLDPPYADTADRTSDLYRCDSESVAHSVREWCIERGNDPLIRIALCGYEGEHVMPDDWECHAWKAHGGYASQGETDGANAKRERIWFSPHCLKERKERSLF